MHDYKTIAERIRNDYNAGHGINDTLASQAFCYAYGGRNGAWSDFKECRPEEARMLEEMAEAERHREETQRWLDSANTSREAERTKLLKQWMDEASAICAEESEA